MGFSILILGLVLFLGVHSVRIVADDWRSAQIGRFGERRWKGLYSIASLAGFALLVWGFGLSRADTPVIWNPPSAMRHVTALLTLVAFILLAAAYVPSNHIKAAIGHPMIAAVKTWAFGHLLANGRLNDIVLFGAFLAWAIVDFIAARRRDRAAGTIQAPGRAGPDAIFVFAGLAAWALFAFVLHAKWIGLSPLG
jgi:uncharacterized membrane protein